MEVVFKVRWSDLDINGHLRHSAYADFAAQARIELLESKGLDMKAMKKAALGPVLFREELIYKREIGPGEKIIVKSYLRSAKRDASRWSFKQLFEKESGEIAAEINVDGAWIDLVKRKLGIPPKEMQSQLLEIEQTADFKLVD